MFSKGQIGFAIFFSIAFIIAMIYAYKKDVVLHRKYYKGSLWILIGFIAFVVLLFWIKTILKE